MRAGKTLLVVLSVAATGAGAAISFRRDSSQVDTRPGALANPFGQRVEHRIVAGAAWARKIRGPLPAVASQPNQPQRVPASATAAILEPKAQAPETQPTFQKTFNPVGSLLEPIDGVAPGDDEPEASAGFAPLDEIGGLPAGASRTHKIADGDTLSKLAAHYLGSAERYLEIFDLNRDLLTSPDLLPIGASLKIPPRGGKPPASGPPRLRDVEPPLPMLDIRGGGPRASQ